jgi:hypothetical protein
MNNRVVNRIIAGGVFLFSLIVYLLTMASTVSFWDCGEFIACSYKLSVPHPPGAPLYLLVGRFFTLLPIFEDIAQRVNLISVLSSAFTVLFLHLSIVHFIKEYFKIDDGFNKYIPHIGGAIGSLTFAFSTSFWFNAVEAEVYAPSMLFTGMVVWLILKWSEKSKVIGNEKYILVIAYLMGLATGVHLLNVLALPMIVMIIYFKKYELNATSWTIMVGIGIVLTLMVYPGVVKGVPFLVSNIGMFGLFVGLVALVVAFAIAVRSHHEVFSILLMSILLIVIGYSSYSMIFIRSNLDPNIDENNPETIEAFISYLNREQYGEHEILNRKAMWRQSPNRNSYSSAFDFFWTYQIKKMYLRYFGWNFLGVDHETGNINMFQFLMIPMLLGLFGMWYHFNKDWQHALTVFVLFFMTGLAVILYLNQPDPQPRERDYSYVGSFFAFSIWIGIGAAGLMEYATKISEGGKKFVPIFVAAVLFFITPIQMFAKNYHTQDRTGNYVAWDYSYNMLVSCEENGILYTNGDNDTFPLWYLQEVDNVRPDVRVANLSLLNTSWYIKQLKHMEPKVPMTLTVPQIDLMTSAEGFGRILHWPQKRTVELTFPPEVREMESKEFSNNFNLEKLPETISFELEPKLMNSYLRVQDYMILNTLYANKFRKPFYFAVTTSNDNQLDGFRRYLRMDGLVLKATTIPDWSIHPEKLYENLVNKFQYRNLDDPNVYYNPNIKGLLQNYRAAYSQLANYYLQIKDTTKFKVTVQKIFEVMPSEVIAYTNRFILQHLETYGYMAGVLPLDKLNSDSYSERELRDMGQLALSYRYFDVSKTAFEEVLEVNPDDVRTKGYLVQTYENLKDYQSAVTLLLEWIEKNPADSAAVRRLGRYRQLIQNPGGQ